MSNKARKDPFPTTLEKSRIKKRRCNSVCKNSSPILSHASSNVHTWVPFLSGDLRPMKAPLSWFLIDYRIHYMSILSSACLIPPYTVLVQQR